MADDTPPNPTLAASYSTAAVARRLGVSVPTVQRWVDLGVLKAWKTVGGHRRIDAESADAFIGGRGPLQAQALPPGPAPAGADSPGQVPGKGPMHGPAVLIVDDNPDDRDLLAALVAEAWPQARITLADNGFQGLVAIGQGAPEVLLSDIVMPHMDGFEMLRHVAQMGRGRPQLLVAVSSLGPAELARRGTLPAGVALVAKPLEPEALITALRDGLAAARATPR